MIMLVYSKDETLLDGFKFGFAFDTYAKFTQGVNEEGYWLLIENDTDDPDYTYALTKDKGLTPIVAGVEVLP